MRTTFQIAQRRCARACARAGVVEWVTIAILIAAAAGACRDHDLVAPTPPHRNVPKPNRSLSDGLVVNSPVDVDTAGVVLGSIYVAEVSHAAISKNLTAYDLGTLDGSQTASTYPTAINDHGQVVGIQYDYPNPGRGFLWTPETPNGLTGAMQAVPDGPAGPAQPLDINDAGQILGTYLATGTGIVLWGCGGVVEVASPISGGAVYPRALNNIGQIAGTVNDASGTSHPFLWTPSAPNGCDGSSVLLDPQGIAWSYASGLNDFGQVVVNGSDGNARLWTPDSRNGGSGSFTVVTGPNGPLNAADINNRGDVLANGAGPYADYCGETSHLFLWRPSKENTAAGLVLDMTPDVGAPYWGYAECWTSGGVLGEEEHGAIQAFSQVTDSYGYIYDQVWTVGGLDDVLAATISWAGTPNEGNALYFDGRGTNPYSSSLTYQWDFGDGTSGSGSTTYHAFADNGQYTVRLTVSDGSGGSNTISTALTIANVAPSGVLGATPAQVGEGGSYTLRVTNVSDSPADVATLQLALDCGDGVGYRSVALGGSLACSSPNEAVRTARAQLRDKDGSTTELSTQVVVFDVAPAVTILSAPPSITEQTTYTISFRFFDPGLLDSWSYTVDWGDGAHSTPTSVAAQGGTLTASHQYQVDKRGGVKSELFTVNVSVADNSGQAGTATANVVVSAKGGPRK